MSDHKVTHDHHRNPGDSNLNAITPVCSCGWRGFAVENYRDDQYSTLAAQERDHKRQVTATPRRSSVQEAAPATAADGLTETAALSDAGIEAAATVALASPYVNGPDASVCLTLAAEMVGAYLSAARAVAPAGVPEGWKPGAYDIALGAGNSAHGVMVIDRKTQRTVVGLTKDEAARALLSAAPTAQGQDTAPAEADVTCYWDAADRESGYPEISDIMENYGYGAVAEIEHVAIVKRTFHATLPAHGDDDDGWEVEALTEAEAQAALDAELARRSSAPSAPSAGEAPKP